MKEVDSKLGEVETALQNELKTATMIGETFNEVYSILVHLEGVISKAEFDKCYNKAAEIFYMATGFKDQVEECIAQVQKRRVILAFNNKLVTSESAFKNRTVVFLANLNTLVRGRLTSFIPIYFALIQDVNRCDRWKDNIVSVIQRDGNVELKFPYNN